MHVLSTPPAFILSQDQTLRCRSNPLGKLSSASVRFASCCPCRLASTATSGPPTLSRWVQRVHWSFQIRSPCGELTFPPPVTFPNLRSGSQPVEQSKGSPSFSKWRRSKHQRVVRTLRHSLIASTRRLFLLTGPHTSTALRPLLPSSGGPDQGPPRRGPFLSAVAKNTGASDSVVYGHPHSYLLFCSNRRSGSVSS